MHDKNSPGKDLAGDDFVIGSGKHVVKSVMTGTGKPCYVCSCTWSSYNKHAAEEHINQPV